MTNGIKIQSAVSDGIVRLSIADYEIIFARLKQNQEILDLDAVIIKNQTALIQIQKYEIEALNVELATLRLQLKAYKVSYDKTEHPQV